jgi:predicted membrane protein
MTVLLILILHFCISDQNILNWIVASILLILSAFIFYLNAVLIFNRPSQIFEVWYILKIYINYLQIVKLLGDYRETNETTAVARQRSARQWTGWKTVFTALSEPMAAHSTMDTATEERCFLGGPCLYVISRAIRVSLCSAVQGNEDLVDEFREL